MMKKIAEAMKALSEEIRLRLLLLLNDGELCVCDLMGALELPQSTISRHLAYLKNNGWVESRRRGIWMHYRLVETMGPFKADVLKALLRELSASEYVRRDVSNLESNLGNRKSGGDNDCPPPTRLKNHENP